MSLERITKFLVNPELPPETLERGERAAVAAAAADKDDGSVGAQDGAQVGAKGRGSGALLMLSIVEPHEEVPETPTIAEAIISAREGTHLESNLENLAIISAREGTHLESNLESHGEVGDGASNPKKEAELNLNKEVDLEAATLPNKEASRSHSPNAATAGKALATAPPPLAAHLAARVQGSFRWQPPEVPISGLIAC